MALRLFPDRHFPDRRFPDRRFPDHIQLPRPTQRCKVHRPIHRDARSPTSTKSLTLVGEHVCQCYGRGKCITLCSGRGINKFGETTVGEKAIGKKTQCRKSHFYNELKIVYTIQVQYLEVVNNKKRFSEISKRFSFDQNTHPLADKGRLHHV